MRHTVHYFVVAMALFLSACGSGESSTASETLDSGPSGSEDTGNPNTPNDPGNEAPRVSADSVYAVLEDLEITYAEGLGHDATSAAPFALPLKLDVYYPDADTTYRTVFMFIHGGGFKGGTKTNTEIIEMGKYYASRGWVLFIDYRTTEECDSSMPQCEDKLREMAQNGMDDRVLQWNRAPRMD